MERTAQQKRFEMFSRNGLQIAEAISTAKNVLNTRYEGALFAFAAGSIFRGQGTRYSDIDIVVVYEHLEAARRESFFANTFPVEAFVHDFATLAWFIDADVQRGRPSILNMIVEGELIGTWPDRAQELREEATRRLSAGPPLFTQQQIDSLRYEITDAIDDLRGERSSHEVLAIGAALYPRLAELALRSRKQWNGAGKWAAKLLLKVDAALEARFAHAFHALFVLGAAEEAIALAEAELNRVGGRLFEGDLRIASTACRRE